MQQITRNIFYKYHLSNNCTAGLLYYDLFYLQKKIYIASQECHDSLVHSLQKLLVSSYAIQFLAIHLTCKSYFSSKIINKSSPISLAMKVNCTQLRKTILIEESYKSMVQWSLNPEWLAKKENNEIAKIYLFKNYIHKQEYLITNKTFEKHNYFCIKQSIYNPSKYVDKIYLIHKLQTIKWIKNKIFIWFQDQSLKEINNQICLITKININDLNKSLYSLLRQILMIGIEWISLQQNTTEVNKTNSLNLILLRYNYFFLSTSYTIIFLVKLKLMNFLYNVGILYILNSYYTTIDKFTKNISITCENLLFQVNKLTLINLFIIKISNCVYAIIKRYIKSFLYHKNLYNYLRINSFLTYKKVINSLNQQFRQLCKCYYSFVSNDELLKLNFISTHTIYKWMKKIHN